MHVKNESFAFGYSHFLFIYMCFLELNAAGHKLVNVTLLCNIISAPYFRTFREFVCSKRENTQFLKTIFQYFPSATGCRRADQAVDAEWRSVAPGRGGATACCRAWATAGRQSVAEPFLCVSQSFVLFARGEEINQTRRECFNSASFLWAFFFLFF
ncbi:hypothetical protein CEXT_44071 [Caerostris extrusa]|uniref:Secreted protein n=1 Tax=Caerostris extrusa TaxID=172846 RepID=A0AAV4XAU6_CAEEX|nr:hypothetical protein CEXT_44071 [Caerostris extrusa]